MVHAGVLSRDSMHARFYSPLEGRFFSPDPMLGNLLRPGSWNRYAYVLDNPLNLTDPTGLAPPGRGGLLTLGDEVITVNGKDPCSVPVEPECLSRDLELEHAGDR